MENNIEYDINIYGNLMITDNKKQNIKVIEVPSIKKLFDERQQLIKFLNDLMEETECAYDYKESEYKNSGKWNLLNEILDFVNKGGKK